MKKTLRKPRVRSFEDFIAKPSSSYSRKRAKQVVDGLLLLADIVAKVPEERPGQGNSAIIESEWPVL
jgi:hypothetical protein